MDADLTLYWPRVRSCWEETMRLEIVIRDEQPLDERYVRAPISLEAFKAMGIEERKEVLYDHFLRAYYEMNGEALS